MEIEVIKTLIMTSAWYCVIKLCSVKSILLWMIQGLKVGVEIVPLAKYSMTDCYDTVELDEIFWS